MLDMPGHQRSGVQPMNESETMAALQRADQLREHDPRAALEVYSSAQPAAVICDVPRLAWVFDQVSVSLDQRFEALLVHAVEHATGDLRRRALQLLASECWYRGRVDEAERYWLEGATAGRAQADELWISCILNVALLYMSRGQTFESLVISGRAKRAARELGATYNFGSSCVRRGMTLVRVGELDRAQAELDEAWEAAALLDDGRRRALLLSTVALWRSKLASSRGNLVGALYEINIHIDFVESLPVARQEVVLLNALCDRIELEFELQPERRDELLAEVETLPSRMALREVWEPTWRLRMLGVRLGHALHERGDSVAALEHGRELLELLPQVLESDYLTKHASHLGQVFREQLDSPEDSRRAYHLAASTALRRILELNSITRELPELAEATQEDWEILDAYGRTLVAGHEQLMEAIRELWSAAHPSVGLLEERGTIKSCAWCRRIRSCEGHWLPVAQFLPTESEFEISHGICPSCSERVMGES